MEKDNSLITSTLYKARNKTKINVIEHITKCVKHIQREVAIHSELDDVNLTHNMIINTEAMCNGFIFRK